MPLTYQPFNEVPAVTELSNELHARRRSAGGEDPLALFGGAILVLAGLVSHGLIRWLLLFLGGTFIRHGLAHK